MLPAIIAAFALALTIGVFILEYRRCRKKELDEKTFLGSREIQNSYSLLHSAMKKAQAIVGAAELESLKIVSEGKYGVRKLEAKYEEEFAQALGKLESDFSENALQAEKSFIQYLADLRTHSEQTQNLLQEMSRQKTAELFERFEQNLSNFLTQTQGQSMNAVNLELQAARQLIDTYKAQQLALIDENVIAMLEKTLSLVLAKKLSLKDQMELVYESLEKAKVEKFIV